MTGTTSFWWQALKKASDLIVNASEDIVGTKLKGQIEERLEPITKLLQDPESRKAFDRAFAQAAQAFEREALTDDERQLRQEVVALLGHTTRKEVRDADRDVIQRYVLASEPNRAPLDRWVRRQLSGQKFVVGQRTYTQEEVTRTLDTFFRQLNRAFWDQPLFRDQVNQADTTELLRQILDALRDQADVATLREDYLDYLRRHLAYLDLGGIAPKVANRTVKLPMRDIFVPVEAWRELDVESAWLQARDLLAYGKGESWRLVPLTDPSKDELEALLADLDDEQDVAWHAFQGQAGRVREAASVQDILAMPRAVLLGHPGTGKSTTLKYVSYAIAAGLGDLVGEAVLERLPILVRLVDYTQALGAAPTLRLRDYVRDLHDKDRAPLFRQGLEEGACLVMLDGLDEVIDPRQRAAIADQVEALVADYPGNHYLLASRVVGYEAGRLTGDFTHFTLGPLPEASMRGFVHKWYEAIEREGGVEDSAEARARADELCQAIEERPGIRRLAENPLLLTIVALVNWRGRKLPNRRVEVYRHATETLIESWPRVRRGVAFDAEEVLGLLEPVAYRIFCDRSSEELAESDLLPLLAGAVAETRPGMSAAGARDYVAGLLPSLSEHSGLFLERGFDAQSGERVFGFLHLTFAEYLAARYLAGQWEAEKDDEKRRAFLARYAHVPRWREVVLLMAQHMGLDGRRVRATQMLADILLMGSPYEEHLHRDRLLAGQCLADDLRVEPRASDWVLDRLATWMMETPIEPLWERIAELGRQMTGAAYEDALVTRLLAWLEDESKDVRARAAWSLGEIKNERAVDGLLLCLEDEGWAVRARAARALGEIKSEKAVGSLFLRLDDEHELVRGNAVTALGEIKSERAVDGLLLRLDDRDMEVRAGAVRALGELESKRAVDTLLDRLKDESTERRAWAARALGIIESERAIDTLIDRLGDESASVRRSAAWALGKLKNERAVDGLVGRLEDEDVGVRINAVLALGAIKNKQTVGALLNRLEDESAPVRYSAAEALGKLKSERTVNALVGCLEDESDEVRVRVTKALGAIKNEQAADALLNRLADESERVCNEAAWALGELKDERAVDVLLNWLGDKSVDVRARAVRALGKLKDERAVDTLVRCLEDENTRVRVRAARALGMIKSERAVDALLNRLAGEHERVRDSIVWALGELKSERVVESILPWLSETRHIFVRSEDIPWTHTPACDWAYTTILEILAQHAPDPGALFGPPAQEARVVGPWSESVNG